MKKIFFDIRDLHVLEVYKIEAYRGAILYAIDNGDWEVIYRHSHIGISCDNLSYNKLRELNFDGILFDYANVDIANKIEESGIPSVNIGGWSYNGRFSAIHQDNHEIGKLGAYHFLSKKFENYAFMGQPQLKMSEDRRDGFKKVLEPLGFKCHTYEADKNTYSAYAAYLQGAKVLKDLTEFEKWLQKLPKPLALMCHHDAYTQVVLDVCRKLGLKIPNDIAVLGVQEFPLKNSCISSIDHNAIECGYEAGRLLDKIIDTGMDNKEQIYVLPKGIIQMASTDIFLSNNKIFKKAMNFIETNFQNNISVKDVAEATGVSEITLNRHFQKEISSSVAREIKEKRFNRAQNLLLDSILSIKEISYLTGFSDISHFSNFFLKKTGTRPSEWRSERSSPDLLHKSKKR